MATAKPKQAILLNLMGIYKMLLQKPKLNGIIRDLNKCIYVYILYM